jgi:hypothetical protein
VLNQRLFYCTILAKVALGLAQTEIVVWPASNFFSIVLILAVILPKTNRADFVTTATKERLKLAARTTVSLVFFPWF